MAIKIAAARRLIADAATWFQSLTKEQQDQYLEMHPNSKYADQAGKGEAQKPALTTKPDTLPKPSAKVTPKEVHEFAHSEEAKPHSETRRTFGQMLKDKLKGVVHHLKDEVKEAGVASHAMTKLMRKKPLTPEDKHALKATAIKLVLVVSSMAVGGGLAAAMAEGARVMAKELAHDFMIHTVMKVAEKTLMSSSVLATDDTDAGLDQMTKMMADYLENGKNVQAILAKASKQ